MLLYNDNIEYIKPLYIKMRWVYWYYWKWFFFMADDADWYPNVTFASYTDEDVRDPLRFDEGIDFIYKDKNNA
jgi:hypothetical protein